MPDLLTSRQVAERLQVTVRAFTTWARKRGIPSIDLGRRRARWRWTDIEAGLEASMVGPAPKGRPRVVPLRRPRGDAGTRIERAMKAARATP